MWRDDGIVFRPRTEQFDNTAVKDPSIVYADGQWHLVYTYVYLQGDQQRYGIGYTCAKDLHALDVSPRHDLGYLSYDGYPLVAPQIFYFAPDNRWYLVAQVHHDGDPRYQAAFCTNTQIDNPDGWTIPAILASEEQLPDVRTAIDFWIICDDHNAYLCFSDQQASVWSLATDISSFPAGFGNPRVMVTDTTDEWELHESAHVYYRADQSRYLMIVEGILKPKDNFRLTLDRCMIAYEADTMNGPWQRIDPHAGRFWADRTNVVDARNAVDWRPVSHPELIRGGCDQRCEIVGPICMLSQTLITKPTTTTYSHLPWELRILQEVSNT